MSATMVPSFITGANARISVGGLTFAYASDVSYNVSVDTIAVETMGRFEAVSNEPVNYSVGSEFSIVRYTSLAISASGGTTIPGVDTDGNGLSPSGLADQFNPNTMLTSGTWELDVYQKANHTTAVANTKSQGVVTVVGDAERFIRITQCRANRMSGNLNKRGIYMVRVSFVGILMSDDSFDASSSGDGDLSKT